MGGVTTSILLSSSYVLYVYIIFPGSGSALLQANVELLYFQTASRYERANELCSEFPQQSRVAECSAHKPSEFSLPYRLNADLSVLFEASSEDHATKSCTEKQTS